MRNAYLVLCPLALSFLFSACGGSLLNDAKLVLPYLPRSSDGAVRFDTGPYKGGTAIVGGNDTAFWISNGKAYAVTPQAQAVAPSLPKAPERIRYDEAFISATHSEGDNKVDSAADQALNEANRLREAGDYEGALQKQIWYHEHALEIDEAQAGVRLSFALMYWMELAEKYPKALEALKSIRDRDTARLLKQEADWQLFQDVSSINENLGEQKATVELFKRIETSNPSFASKVFNLAESELVSAGEYALAKKYLGSPVEQFDKAKRSYEENILSYAPDEDSRQAFRNIFTKKVVNLIKILNATGESAQAKDIQTKALKVVDAPESRSALDS